VSALLAFLLRIGFGGIVDKALGLIEARAAGQESADRLRALMTVELARSAVAEAKIMADFNKAKLAFPWFWIFAAAFIVPLAIWWAAVILDSVFGFAWSVADLPTPQMQEWAGDMIRWVFYVGSGVGVVRSLR
jgi:hypothetical protein